MTQVDYDVAIIGAGAGGITTAIYCARAGLKVALIEKGLYGGQLHNTEMVENYTGFQAVLGQDLSMAMESHARAQDGITHIYGDVMNVNEEEDSFLIEIRNKSIRSKTVVVATGVKHKKLAVDGESEYDGKGLSYCAVCDGGFFKGKDVTVIGGGDSAVEAALYMSNIAKNVKLVHRRDELRADRVTQQKMNETDNIEVIWDALTENVKGIGGTVAGITFVEKDSGDRVFLPSDGIFVNIGMVPVTGFLRSLNEESWHWLLDSEGFITTHSDMSVMGLDGMYAVGDVRANSIRQVVSATGDGAVASDSIVKYLQRLG